LQAFLEFIVNIGQWFFILFSFLFVLFTLFMLLYRLKYVQRATIDPVGPLIIILLFVMPCCSISTYAGSLLDGLLWDKDYFTLIFLIVGILGGIRLWWWARH